MYDPNVTSWCGYDHPYTEYSFVPRKDIHQNLDMFIRARMKNPGVESTLRVEIFPEDNHVLKQSVFLANIASSTQWSWLQLTSPNGVFQDLEDKRYILRIYAGDSDVQVDAFILTPTGNQPVAASPFSSGRQTNTALSFVSVLPPTCHGGGR